MIGETEGILKEIQEKQEFLLNVMDQDKKLSSDVVQTLVLKMDNFKDFVSKFEIKKHVRDKCSDQTEQEITEACHLLAFFSLMVDLEEEKLIDMTVTLIAGSSHSVLDNAYLNYKNNLKAKARDFYEETFITKINVEIGCSLSFRPIVQLDKEQKQQLTNFVEHLQPGLGTMLEEKEAQRLKSWQACGE